MLGDESFIGLIPKLIKNDYKHARTAPSQEGIYVD